MPYDQPPVDPRWFKAMMRRMVGETRLLKRRPRAATAYSRASVQRSAR